MITLTEKDGATIIVIENPSEREKELIQQAKDVLSGKTSVAETKKTNVLSATTPQKKSSIWDRYKSPNTPKKEESKKETKEEILNFNPEDFESILDIDEDDVPF